MDTHAEFAGKLSLALKVANMSRGGLALAAGVDKSLVGRWARGLVRPTDHNLSLITDAFRKRLPGFSRLAWDLSPEAFAQAIGVPAHAAPAAGPSAAGSPAALAEVQEHASCAVALPHSVARSQVEVRREGCAYPGTYVGFRLAFRNNGDLTSEVLTLWRDGDRLFFRQTGMAFTHHGEALLIRSQLYLLGEEDERVNGLYFVVLNGVSGARALRLDGIFATVYGDKGHTPSATVMVFVRVLDGGPEGAAPDTALVERVTARLRNIQNAGGLADLAGPAVIEALDCRLGAPTGPGCDRVMRVPAWRSLAVSELDATPGAYEHMEDLRAALVG